MLLLHLLGPTAATATYYLPAKRNVWMGWSDTNKQDIVVSWDIGGAISLSRLMMSREKSLLKVLVNMLNEFLGSEGSSFAKKDPLSSD